MATASKLPKREKTRLQLIEAGITVLAEKDIYSASIDELTCCAGVARGTFYNYFVDRQALVIEISEHIRTLLANEIVNKIPEHYTLEQRTSCIVYGFVHYAVQHPEIGWALVRIGGSSHWVKPEAYSPNILALQQLLLHRQPPIAIHLALHYLEGSGLITMRRRLEQVLSESEADHLLLLVLQGLFGLTAPPLALRDLAKQFIQDLGLPH